MRRPALMICGFVFTAVAAVGVVVPLLPTTPFLLLAAACFARSSKRLHAWLLGHRVFGQSLREWERWGAIRRRVKVLASLMMTGMVAYPLAMGDFAIGFKAAAAASVAAVLGFIWTRPEPPA